MIELRETTEFSKWLSELKDRRARDRIQVRLARLALGLAGDVEPVAEGVSELRIDYGPGYRVYFKRRGTKLTFLLAGGDKSTQRRDIKLALELARNL
jgi:putative addiction module killer protein